MALDDLYVLDFKQMFNNQDIHSIFTYENVGVTFASDLAAAFIEDMLQPIHDIQANVIQDVSLDIINLGNLSDNNFTPLTGQGSLSGSNMLPLHDAINYTLKPVSRAVRPGSKRFSGIPEVAQAEGEIADATYISQVEALRDALATEISSDDTNYFHPIVIKRVKYVVPDSDPERFAYRFPEIGETPVYARLAGVLVNLHVSHQNSRS